MDHSQVYLPHLLSLWYRLRYGWHLVRWLRLGLGIGIAGSGWQGQETAVLLFGALLALQGLLNLGCTRCAAGSCSPHAAKMAHSPATQDLTP